jgi:hypothetical protein
VRTLLVENPADLEPLLLRILLPRGPSLIKMLAAGQMVGCWSNGCRWSNGWPLVKWLAAGQMVGCCST